MKCFVSLALFIILNNASAQLPIGKNIQIAEKELKSFFQKEGYHFVKKESQTDLFILVFSEEFTILVQYNYYENVEALIFLANSSDVLAKLKHTLKFSSWKYINSDDRDLYYTYNNMKIKMPINNSLFQFTVEK